MKKQKANSNEDLDVIILETIDEVLSSLGESPKAENFFICRRISESTEKKFPITLPTFQMPSENFLRGDQASRNKFYEKTQHKN